MNCINNTENFIVYKQVSEIPEGVWEFLSVSESVYFSSMYLNAIASHNPKIKFKYLVLKDEFGVIIAFSILQLVDFYLDSVQNEMKSTVKKIKDFAEKLKIFRPERAFKVLLCGNTFVSGEHGIFIKQSQNKKKVIKLIANAIDTYVKSSKFLNKNVSAYLLKDFDDASLKITNELHDLGYYSFNVEPNMKMNIDFKWNTFEDYLSSLRTKFRVKAKKALKLSKSLKEVNINSSNIDDFLPEMKALYKSVTASSGFNLGNFNLDTYKDLLQNLDERYIVKAYFLEGKLVGFLSALKNASNLDAHFVGIDYELNRTYAIYQRMLYDYIKIAIKLRCSVLNFGRTASEIKSSVGAGAQSLTVYVRHKGTVKNSMLKKVLKKIQPTPFRESKPFKQEV